MGRMWQAGYVGAVAGEGDYRRALEGVTARVMVMPSKTDQYFSVDDGETEAMYLKNGRFNPIPTIWGHIRGGGANEVDSKWVDTEITQFLIEGDLGRTSIYKVVVIWTIIKTFSYIVHAFYQLL
jgi:homoserine acetyltransferase